MCVCVLHSDIGAGDSRSLGKNAKSSHFGAPYLSHSHPRPAAALRATGRHGHSRYSEYPSTTERRRLYCRTQVCEHAIRETTTDRLVADRFCHRAVALLVSDSIVGHLLKFSRSDNGRVDASTAVHAVHSSRGIAFYQ